MFTHFIVLLFGFGESPIGFIIAIFLLLLLVRLLIGIFKDGFSIARAEKAKVGELHYGTETRSEVDFQLKAFPYYQRLPQNGKEEFITRCLNFINTFTIEGEDDYDPNFAAKIHVAAAATELTFGISDFPFTNFNSVLLYPGIFKMSENGPLMKGATTPNGTIRISIKDFDEGYAQPTNKLNVGLHEFGHALFMEFLKKVKNEDDDSMSNVVYPYLAEADHILNGGKHNGDFLRAYAFTNRQEFFAVSVEHFFEAPYEFKEKLPVLYKVMVALLNQDPTNQMKIINDKLGELQ
ncbi:MAG: zinc-dependent peptidase [Bacteroidetes bacterium]|nr:zinc-dependent peptidase [Bacteroidota bacterium]